LDKPLDGPVPREAMAGIKLEVSRLTVSKGRLDVTLRVENKSAFRLPAFITTNNPISFSWAFGPAGRYYTESSLAWDPRWRLQSDLQPGGADNIDLKNLEVPKIAGDYVIWFSMVQDNVEWFHNAGMRPARGSYLIRVGSDGSVALSPL